MSEIEAPRADEAAAPAPTEETFGRRLAAERERQGLSIDDVAARLRLHPRQVQAIESEALPSLPAPFLRGFVRNYAKELRLDPEPLVAELSARLGPQAEKLPRAEAGGTAAPRLVTTDLASRRVVVGGTLAALIALAVLGWLATRSEQRVDVTQPPAAKPALPAATPSTVAPASDAAKDAQLPGNGSPAGAGAPSSTPAGTAPAEGTAAVAAPAPVAAPVGAAAAFDGLRMSFRDQSWVEVAQGDGRIILSQINAAGTEQRIEGKPPLKVVVGNASGVAIEYRGKPVDLKSVTSPDNVARITLN